MPGIHGGDQLDPDYRSTQASFAEELRARSLRGAEVSALVAKKAEEDRRLEALARDEAHRLARIRWVDENLDVIKVALGRAADTGARELRLDCRELTPVVGLDIGHKGRPVELARLLAEKLGMAVADRSTYTEHDMGDSAAPCRETIFNPILYLSW